MSRSPRSRRLGLESLEDRSLLSVNPLDTGMPIDTVNDAAAIIRVIDEPVSSFQAVRPIWQEYSFGRIVLGPVIEDYGVNQTITTSSSTGKPIINIYPYSETVLEEGGGVDFEFRITRSYAISPMIGAFMFEVDGDAIIDSGSSVNADAFFTNANTTAITDNFMAFYMDYVSLEFILTLRIRNNAKVQDDRSFSLTFSDPVMTGNPSSYEIGDDATVDCGILDDDTIALEKVIFNNQLGMVADPGQTVWSTTEHWVKNQPDKTVPIAYSCGDTNDILKAEAEFSGLADDALALEVRFVGRDFPGADVYSAWVSIDVDTFEMSAIAAALSDFVTIYCTQQADYIPGMELDWELRVNGDDDDIREVEGSSVNPFYLTRDDPIGGGPYYHTVVHTGCVAADGHTTEDTAFNGIWGAFKGKAMFAYQMKDGVVVPCSVEVYLLNGVIITVPIALTYYGKDAVAVGAFSQVQMDAYLKRGLHVLADMTVCTYPSLARQYGVIDTVTNQPIEPSTFFTRGLLEKLDATCDGWANFMHDVLAAQGIESSQKGIEMVDSNKRFKTKDDMSAQGTADPKECIFPNHAVIKYDNKVFDPSYGLEYGDFDDAIAAFVEQAVESIGTSRNAATNDNSNGYGKVYGVSGTAAASDFKWRTT